MLKVLSLLLFSTLWMSCSAAEVERLSGQGTLVRRFVSTPLTVNLELKNGDEIILGAASEALVRISQKVAFVLRARSSVTLSDVNDETGFTAKLWTGALRYASALAGQDKFRVTTPHTSVGMRGTDFDILVLSSPIVGGLPPGTYVTVNSGAVEVTDISTADLALVTNAQAVYAQGPSQDMNEADQQTQVTPMPAPTLTDTDQISSARSLTLSTARPPGILSLGQLSKSVWRIEPLSVQRGEFDDLLNIMR